MNLKKPYLKNDKVLVKTYVSIDVCVILKERYIASQSEFKLGVDGWEAQIYKQKDVEKLRKLGVPYKKGEKPMVFVPDWQIIKKC